MIEESMMAAGRKFHPPYPTVALEVQAHARIKLLATDKHFGRSRTNPKTVNGHPEFLPRAVL